MSVLVRYVPSSEDEVFDILNLLDERLKHSNTGVVLVRSPDDTKTEKQPNEGQDRQTGWSAHRSPVIGLVSHTDAYTDTNAFCFLITGGSTPVSPPYA